MTEKFKILVTRKWPKKVEEKLLTTFDATLNVEDRPLSEAELVEGMRSYDALLPTVTAVSYTHLTLPTNRGV